MVYYVTEEMKKEVLAHFEDDKDIWTQEDLRDFTGMTQVQMSATCCALERQGVLVGLTAPEGTPCDRRTKLYNKIGEYQEKTKENDTL